MSVTVFGIAATADGHAMPHTERWLDDYGHVRTEYRSSAHPAAQFRAQQPASIPVDLDHDDDPVGDVVHLERLAGNLWAVAVIDGIDPDRFDQLGPLYWSAATIAADMAPDALTHRDMDMYSIAVTEHPAGIGLPPLRHLPGDIRRSVDRRYWPDAWVPDVVRRAASTCDRRRPGDPLTIADPHADAVQQRRRPTGTGYADQFDQLEHFVRGGGRVLAVH